MSNPTADKFIDYIKKGTSVFDLAKLFGDFDKFLSFSKKYPELKKYVDYITSGRVGIKSNSGKIWVFDFQIRNINVDNDGETEFWDLTIDLKLDDSFSDVDKLIIANWVNEYLQDIEQEFFEFNDEKLNNHIHTSAFINKVNGKNFMHIEDKQDESEVESILSKKSMNENVISEIKEIRNLLKKIM
jgi:hypothetical protein